MSGAITLVIEMSVRVVVGAFRCLALRADRMVLCDGTVAVGRRWERVARC